MNKNVVLAIILAAILVTAGVALAAYLITSNTVNVTVLTQATMTLQANSTSLTVGDTVQLTATLSDGAASSGLAVTFLDGATTLATVNADTSGVAVYAYAPAAGSYVYTATATHP